MKNYSLTTSGLIVMIVGSLIATLGFSEVCTGEIVDKLSPVIGSLPGLIMAWVGRFRQGDINIAGFKK